MESWRQGKRCRTVECLSGPRGWRYQCRGRFSVFARKSAVAFSGRVLSFGFSREKTCSVGRGFILGLKPVRGAMVLATELFVIPARELEFFASLFSPRVFQRDRWIALSASSAALYAALRFFAGRHRLSDPKTSHHDRSRRRAYITRRLSKIRGIALHERLGYE